MEIAEPLVDALHVDVKHCRPLRRSSMSGRGQPDALEMLAVPRNAVTEHKVDEGDEEIDLDAEAHPPGIDDDGFGGAQQVEQTDDDHEGRVLEERDEGVDERRDGHPQRLRQHDQDGRRPVGKPDAGRRFVLPARDRLQSTANDFGHVRGDDHDDATCARSSLSIVRPCGTNSGNITAAMNRNVTSGTPRTSSMYAMHRPLIAGSSDRRPSASATASGKAAANPTVERSNVNGSPPQNSLGTS